MSNPTVSVHSHPLQQIERDRFAVACNQAAEIMRRPEYGDRLDKAIDFVLGGYVTLHDDGTATVKSGSHTYEILDACTCQDSQQHSMNCKHFLAVTLLKRTYERLGERHNANGQQPEATQPAAWECAQAPSSCTLKWMVGGIEMLLTLRDMRDDALFYRIKRVLPRIEEKMDAQRQRRHERQQAQNNGGNGGNTATATETEEEPYCNLHEVPLRRYSKDGRTWYSHYDIDTQSWCRGR